MILTLSITDHCFGNTQNALWRFHLILRQIRPLSTFEFTKAMVLGNSNTIPRGHFGNTGGPSGCLGSQEC